MQFSAINALFCFTVGPFKAAGIKGPIYATVSAGVVNAVLSIVSIFLVEGVGRRSLPLITLGRGEFLFYPHDVLLLRGAYDTTYDTMSSL